MMKKFTALMIMLSVTGMYAFSQGNWYSQKDFGGSARYASVGFSIGTKGYIGTGIDASGFISDFWEWDQTNNTWTQKASYPTGVAGAVGFAAGGKGYIGTGYDGSANTKEFYEWDPSTNTWTLQANYRTKIQLGLGFSIGSKGYLGGGYDGSSSLKEFWEYDVSTATWTQKADFGGTARYSAASLAVGSKGYVGLGSDGTNYYEDFWEYDPSGNTWTKKADFPGGKRFATSQFAIGSKGYVGTGQDGTLQYYDFWEWDPAANSWTRVANFRGGPRYWGTAFSIGNLGYVGTGAFVFSGTTYATVDLWEFNPLAPGFLVHPTDTQACVGGDLILKVQGYGDSVMYKWQKDEADISSFSNDSFLLLSSTTINDTGSYRCIIKNSHGYDTSLAAQLDLTSGAPSIDVQPVPSIGCKGYEATVSVEAKSNSQIYYQWYKDGQEISGANQSELIVSAVNQSDTGYYYCAVYNVCGSQLSDSVKVTYSPPPSKPTVTVEWNAVLSSPAAAYQWRKYNAEISGATSQRYYPTEKAKYSVETTDEYGCTKLSDEVLWDFSAIQDPSGKKVVNVYPNPNNGSFELELNSRGKVDVTIMNTLGKIVYEASGLEADFTKHPIELDGVEDGVYFIHIKGDEINYLYNFIIRK